MILADKILELRKQNGWSQEELADKLGVSRQAVSKWEGAQSIPDMERIIALSRLFGVSTDLLVKDEIDVMGKNVNAGENACQEEAGVRMRVIELEEALRLYCSQNIICRLCCSRRSSLYSGGNTVGRQ